MELAIVRQGLSNSSFAKDKTNGKIKALIDEYARQVQNNLKSVQDLSQAQRNELMSYEMKELVDYIPKSFSMQN